MSRFDTDTLKLAFSLHVAGMILALDTVEEQEAAFLARTFPAEVLDASGFLRAGERTDLHAEAAMEALDVLPDLLDLSEKLALMQVLVDAVLADGRVDPEEARVLVDGARLLDLPDHVVERLLKTELDVSLDQL